MKTNVTPGETPVEITVSMIDQDLQDGISKPEMAIKYGIKPWEVDEMFKHPFLKGRRPSRKKTLSFSFVDDVTMTPDGENIIDPVIENDVIIDPNQVTLEDAIDEAIESVEGIKDQMQQTQEAIVEMLSPTEFEEEEVELPSFEDTMEIVKEQQEDELEEDDDTFEL